MARLRIDDMKPLAVLRVKVGLSRKEAAKVLNIGENTLARYELGEVDLSFGIGERMTVLYCVSFETIQQAVKKTKEIFGKIPQEK